VAVLADVRALLLVPKPIVRAAGTEAGSVGRPSVLAELTFDVRF
jgi:hypothetical protein